MSQVKIGHYEQDGGLVYVPVGFIPDFLLAFDRNSASGSGVLYMWWREMEDYDPTTDTVIDGISITDGTDAELAAAGGFAAYDGEAAAPTVTNHAVSTAYVLEATDPALCFVRPPVDATDEDGNVVDRDAIFQCTTAGTSSATAPTAWPAVLGGTLLDGTAVWTRVNEATFRKGYQGFRVAAAIQTNAYEMYYTAFQGDGGSQRLGDSAEWSNGIYGS